MNHHRLAVLGLGIVALANGGCLLATVGAVGAAGAGYAYYQGKVSRDFQANYDEVRSAVYAALADLRLPIVGEERIGNLGFIDSLTGTGEKVHVEIETLPAPIPADAVRTRVGARIGTFGNNVLSERILYQTSLQLGSTPRAAASAATQAWGPPASAAQAITPVSHTQTAEPPLSRPPQ